ncbi:PqqD family protein [Novosphingobium cyanobacteriorum]|uniref:PqqD family protein n=1 Tax=Novosphingobium cyanobacteriorum TaxID=3024215 RepID=A0ABT6CEW9_9SPHN|nr:PqqD family protein [Novosphingobium cyanobacteriorum]MDF8332455.1 PqqD family protein [Novosphingobium cyanobacteriorum]
METAALPADARLQADFDLAVRRSANATTAEIDGQVVALDLNTGTCFGLNRVASRIWQLIETPASAREVTQSLLQVYDVPAQTCATQTADLLRELVEIGLAERA